MIVLFMWMALEQAGLLSAFVTRLIGAAWIVAGAGLLWKGLHVATS